MRSFWIFAPFLASNVQASFYLLTDNWVGTSFLSEFTWENIADPTHGRVNYLPQSESLARGLTVASSNSLVLKADSTTVLSPSGPGRDSNRIMSRKQFGHNTILVADIKHMPFGCGTWPALWTTNVGTWPNDGEVDILEGVNIETPNVMTLHTGANCTMPLSRSQKGTAVTTDCYWLTNGNAGCGVISENQSSYGDSFNNVGGGWYAMERTPTFIKVWFWSRNDPLTPADVTTPGQAVINSDNWGVPSAFFPNTQCDIASKFGAHNVIINLTFCGDWAGAVYGTGGCPGTCIDNVNNNPSAFANAYWDIAAIRMYALSGSVDSKLPSTSSTTTLASATSAARLSSACRVTTSISTSPSTTSTPTTHTTTSTPTTTTTALSSATPSTRLVSVCRAKTSTSTSLITTSTPTTLTTTSTPTISTTPLTSATPRTTLHNSQYDIG
ncbi:hypothetical protein FS842_008542 [Serendipita sp. 407]|nr:hypothetical protein FS842_008542 [Serendipita sp. 407]